jgi:hypothetical protein
MFVFSFIEGEGEVITRQLYFGHTSNIKTIELDEKQSEQNYREKALQVRRTKKGQGILTEGEGFVQLTSSLR